MSKIASLPEPAAQKNIVLLVGAPRSGTTWLGKIFDSHPDVLYRHEPDTILRNNELPVICSREGADSHIDSARRYLLALLNVQAAKTVGGQPFFRKRYRPLGYHGIRTATIYGIRVAEALFGRNLYPSLAVPDLIPRLRRPQTTYVLKSVSARGRLAPFSKAFPRMRIIFLVRHPCGQVASMLAGINAGKFERAVPFAEILWTEEAREIGLTAERFEKLDVVEKCAWHWAILNQKALNDLAGFERATVARYEALCSEPLDWSNQLFAFAELPWDPQTEDFLKKSTSTTETEGYYAIMRNSRQVSERWRRVLSSGDQERILKIADRLPVGKAYTNCPEIVIT